jgi:NodT family efflux transporter outer membrane factor (OMF) lipoprotein
MKKKGKGGMFSSGSDLMEKRKKMGVRALSGFALILSLAGCAVGPDFKAPAAPDVSGYTASPVPPDIASAPTVLGKSQRIIEGAPINSQWWRELGSSKLECLIDEALLNSPTLAAAEAAFRQAQELFAARAGSTRYPQVEGGLGGQRQRFNPGTLGQAGDAREFSLYTAEVGVSYTFDLAGGNRRALEELAARIDYQHFEREGARLTLAANIAITAINQARLTAQVQITENILRSQEEQLEMTQEQVRLGRVAPDEISALQTQVGQTRASIPSRRQQLQESEHLLAILVGRAPGAGGLPSFTLEDFTLPSELPLVVPSALVRARPDIRATEALLQAANAEYGVAVAKLYPQLNLSANLGSQALTAGALFGSGSAIWSLVGQLTQPPVQPGFAGGKASGAGGLRCGGRELSHCCAGGAAQCRRRTACPGERLSETGCLGFG